MLQQSLAVYLVLVVLAACVIVFSASTRGWVLRTIAAAIGLTVTFGAGLLLFDSSLTMRGGATLFFARSPWKELLLFGVMLVGMASKYLWDLIEARKKRRKSQHRSGDRILLGFDAWEFLQPLLVSGIVFAATLHSDPSLTLSQILFSYQNGFCWQTVLKKS